MNTDSPYHIFPPRKPGLPWISIPRRKVAGMARPDIVPATLERAQRAAEAQLADIEGAGNGMRELRRRQACLAADIADDPVLLGSWGVWGETLAADRAAV
jgi:hypothetical protein